MQVLNKKARRDYYLLEAIEAGIQLTGPEVKSIREGKVSLEGAHVQIGIGNAPGATIEARLIGLRPAPYLPAGQQNIDPSRPKKLLLHRDEILSLWHRSRSKSTTIIPFRIYSKGGWIKVQIGLARGKKKWQKREAKKRRDIQRDVERTLRSK